MDSIPQTWRHRPHFGAAILNSVGEHRHKLAAFVVILGCASSAFGRSATGIFKYSLLTTPLLFGADYLNRRRTGELGTKITAIQNAIGAYRANLERLGQTPLGQERAQIVQRLRDGNLSLFFEEAPKSIALLVDVTATQKSFEAWPLWFETQPDERNALRSGSSQIASGLLNKLGNAIQSRVVETPRSLPPLEPAVEKPENIAGRTIALPFERQEVVELEEISESDTHSIQDIINRLTSLNQAVGSIPTDRAMARDQDESRHRDLVHLLVGIGPFAFWLVT